MNITTLEFLAVCTFIAGVMAALVRLIAQFVCSPAWRWKVTLLAFVMMFVASVFWLSICAISDMADRDMGAKEG